MIRKRENMTIIVTGGVGFIGSNFVFYELEKMFGIKEVIG